MIKFHNFFSTFQKMQSILMRRRQKLLSLLWTRTIPTLQFLVQINPPRREKLSQIFPYFYFQVLTKNVLRAIAEHKVENAD